MINASTITRAMEQLLIDGLDSDKLYHIERSEYVNFDPDRVPYVGVYRGQLKYAPHTLGRDLSSWRADFTITLIVQAASINTGGEAEERLEKYLQEVLNVVVADKTIKGTVAIIKDIEINYTYKKEESGTMHFHAAEVDILTEVRTQ